MSRTETANRLTVSGVTERIESWSDHIEATRRAEARLTEMQADLATKVEATRRTEVRLTEMQADLAAKMQAFETTQRASVDEMARALLPLAAAMAQLIEETRRTLEEIAEESREVQRQARTSTEAASKEAGRVLGDLQASALKLEARIQGFLTAAQTPPPPPPNPWIAAVVSPVLLCGLAVAARLAGWL